MFGGHKKACLEMVLANCARTQAYRRRDRKFVAVLCMICLEEPTNPTSLPCGHAFCARCVAGLRENGVTEVCPLCRAPLPVGKERLYELADRVWWKIKNAVGSSREWPPLSASQQKEMDGAIVMAQEAMDQVSGAWEWAGAIPTSALTRLYGTLHAGPPRRCFANRFHLQLGPRRGGRL